MARYIDADALIDYIRQNVMTSSRDSAECKEFMIDHIGMEWFAPTADVVPRAEVEELLMRLTHAYEKVDIAEDEVERLEQDVTRLEQENETLKDSNEHLAVLLAEAKSEVAREIFAEIERIIGEKYNRFVFGNNDLDSIEQDAIINFSDTIADCFAEIKKKYTED